MNTFAKYATAAAVVGALAASAATPTLARGWHHHGFGAGAAGFAAGALVGAAAANAAATDYYAPGYAYAPDYAYGPAYDYGPAVESYAYAPAVGSYAYAPPARSYYGYSGWNEHACTLSPASVHYVPCYNRD